MTDGRDDAGPRPTAGTPRDPTGPASTASDERILLLECRLAQLRSQLESARVEADLARTRLAEAAAREADHARRYSAAMQELAEARAEIASLHRRLEHSEALRAQLEGQLFEPDTRGDAEELVRLRREVLVERHRADVNERIAARLRQRVEELEASRETILSHLAEWQQLVRREGPDAVDLARYLSDLRREILDLEARCALAERREAAYRRRLAMAGIDPDEVLAELQDSQAHREPWADAGAVDPLRQWEQRIDDLPLFEFPLRPITAVVSENGEPARGVVTDVEPRTLVEPVADGAAAGPVAAADTEAGPAVDRDGGDVEPAAENEEAASDPAEVGSVDAAATPEPAEVVPLVSGAAPEAAEATVGGVESAAAVADVALEAADTVAGEVQFAEAADSAAEQGGGDVGAAPEREDGAVVLVAGRDGAAVGGETDRGGVDADAAAEDREATAVVLGVGHDGTADGVVAATDGSADDGQPEPAPPAQPLEERAAEPEVVPEPLNVLVAALENADILTLRIELRRCVRACGEDAVLDVIRPRTGSSRPAVRAAAYEALGLLLGRDPAALEPFVRAGLDDPDGRVRRRVVLAAAAAQGLPLRSLLEPIRTDPDPQVRRVVLEVLRHLPPSTGEERRRSDESGVLSAVRPVA
ncbi:MAG: HEAT repeat domain-containing protein [bacterium]|jgi:hypothetical protein|nr:MAG: hypothetical protein DIU52_10900 [bacterium]